MLAIEDEVTSLVEDEEFWRYLARSLAVFLTPTSLATFRLPNRLAGFRRRWPVRNGSARRVDVGQGTDVSWVVLADPEGNEFCVLRAFTEQSRRRSPPSGRTGSARLRRS